MNLSEFIQMMYSFIGNGMGKAKFTIYLFSVFEREPDVGDNPAFIDDDGKFNPIYGKDPSAQRKIFNGKLKLGRETANDIKKHFSDTDFIDAVYSLGYKQKELLVEKLRNYGFTVEIEKVDEFCADLFLKLMDALSEGKDSVNPKESILRDDKGKRVKAIPLPMAYVADGKLHVGGDTLSLPPNMTVNEKISSEEEPYIQAICEAFSDVLHEKVTPESIDALPKRYQRDFKDQRNYYNNAAWLQRSVRDISDDGENQFQILKEDAYEGIKETYYRNYQDGYERLNQVLIKITSTTLNRSTLTHIKNLVGNQMKKGLCHMMVNDRMIISWVDPDAE